MKAIIFVAILLCCTCQPLSAQDANFHAGLRLGGGISSNSNVDRILVSEDYYSNYSLRKRVLFVPCAELFFLYKPQGNLWGVEAGIVYYNRTARVRYDDRDELNYTLSARYHHLGLAAYFNLYPFKERNTWHVSLGGRLGANLSPENLSYEGNQEDKKFEKWKYPSVEETERVMRSKLKGRPDAALGGGVGYDFHRGICIDLRFHYSLGSTIKTETNTFNWVECANHNWQAELTVAYVIDIK